MTTTGEGVGPIWGRSNLRAGTFPGDSVSEGTVVAFCWGRSGSRKSTFPIHPWDLPRLWPRTIYGAQY